jgi:hypothetical protein
MTPVEWAAVMIFFAVACIETGTQTSPTWDDEDYGINTPTTCHATGSKPAADMEKKPAKSRFAGQATRL